jgi:pyruvate,water dikinase
MITNLNDAKETAKYGGKAVNLYKLLASGFQVPAGFAVSTDSEAIMTEELKASLLENFDTLGAKYVAVRSSAVVEDGDNDSWAGQLETYLNISRDSLIEAVQNCWLSAQSDRATAYAKQTGARIEPQNVAVIVQTMIDSDVSGVAFSLNPVITSNEVVIEAGYGLGEAIVSGSITPDNYVVDKMSHHIEKYISVQTKMYVRVSGANKWQEVDTSKQSIQKLSDESIRQVFEETIKIEQQYGKPMDIEWAIADNELYITQARPITTAR